MKEKLKLFLEKEKPFIEGAKEVARYIVLFLVSGLLVQLINQISKIPETQSFNIWVFQIDIPIRIAFQLLFTALGRFVDKALYEIGKKSGSVNLIKGLVRF